MDEEVRMREWQDCEVGDLTYGEPEWKNQLIATTIDMTTVPPLVGEKTPCSFPIDIVRMGEKVFVTATLGDLNMNPQENSKSEFSCFERVS